MLRPTLHFPGVTDDAESFYSRLMQSANGLKALGIGAGDVVALMLYNEPLMVELQMAARHLGAHFCLINWHFKAAEVAHILTDSQAKLLIVNADLQQQIEGGVRAGLQVAYADPTAATRRAFGLGDASFRSALSDLDWTVHRAKFPVEAQGAERPGSLMAYTSGTTGLPKGIKRVAPTPEQVQSINRLSATALGLVPGARVLVSAPLYHSAPCSYVGLAAILDTELWLEPRFDPERTLQLIATEQITHAYLVPTMYTRLLKLPPSTRARYDVSSLQFVASTGAPCPHLVKRDMIEWFGPVIHESYASSEFGYITHIDSHESLQKPGSAGRPMEHATVRIVSEEGQTLPSGTVGLIYARHHGVPDFTYSGNHAARQKLELDHLWTLGDMGYLDQDGYLFVVDRKADMVISGGVNIYPAEIEAVLITMEGVADCAVFGIPCSEFGERLLAVVQPRPEASLTSEAIQAFLRARIAGFKVPREIVFAEQLPREETGKIFKRRLREPYWSSAGRSV